MPPQQKKAILQSWRLSLAGNGPRFLVVFDVNVKPPDVPWSPLVINFDLPRSVEGYAARAAAAVPPAQRQGTGPSAGANASANGGNANGVAVNGVIVSFVQAAGGDVEMLRSTECAYRFKVSGSGATSNISKVIECGRRLIMCKQSAEIPSVFHDLFQH